MPRPILEFDLKAFGKRVKRYRQRRALSIANSESYAGVPRHTIARIESATIGEANATPIVLLSAWIGVDPREFLKPKGE